MLFFFDFFFFKPFRGRKRKMERERRKLPMLALQVKGTWGEKTHYLIINDSERYWSNV